MRLPECMLGLLVAMLAAARIGAAQTTGPVGDGGQSLDLRQRVLFASLSAYSDDTRQDAQEQLMSMGEVVEAGLEFAAATAIDGDARQRARTVLEELKTRRRLRELMQPTRVTLHFDDAPTRQVLGSLYVRAGARPRLLPPDPWQSAGDDPVTVHLDDVPFWDAVAKLEELTGLTLIDAGWGARFARVPADQVPGRMSVRGPFRIVAEDGPMPGNIRSFKFFLEPKISVVSHARQATLTDHDELAGQPLALGWLGRQAAVPRVIGRSADVLEVEMPLMGMIGPAAPVRGTVPALLVVREEVVEDLNPFSGRADLGGRTFAWAWQNLDEGVHGLTIEEAAQMLGPRALATDFPGARPMLYDARRRPLLRSYLTVLRPGVCLWRFHQRLSADVGAEPDAGPPARLALALPTVTREIRIPFEFGPPPRPDGR